MKKFFRSSLILLTIFLLVPSGIYLTGCSKAKENPIIKYEYSEYLNISKSSLEKHSFNASETIIFTKAVERLNKFVELKSNTFIMNIDSGLKIGIAEDLFEYFRNKMSYTNKLLGLQQLKVYQGKLTLPIASGTNLSNIPRLKSGAESGWTVWSNDHISIYWWGVTISLTHADLKEIVRQLTIGTGITLILSGILGISSVFFPPLFAAASVAAGITAIIGGTALLVSVFSDDHPQGVNMMCDWSLPVPIMIIT